MWVRQGKGKKHTTFVKGLENYNVNLKDAAKAMSKKMASGCSATNDKKLGQVLKFRLKALLYLIKILPLRQFILRTLKPAPLKLLKVATNQLSCLLAV